MINLKRKEFISLIDAERILKIRKEDFTNAKETFYETYSDNDFQIAYNLECEINLLENVISFFELNEKNRKELERINIENE